MGGSGGVSPYSWSVSPALPDGLSFDSSTGAITGTPTSQGTTVHTFALQDSSSPPQSVQKSFSITISDGPPPLSITTSSPLPDGNVGRSYTVTVQAEGGTGALTWSVPSGSLPQNLNLDSATGTISGIPTAAGTSNFTLRVADGAGQTDAQPYSLTIIPPSPPTITTTSPLPGATVGQAYSQTLQAAGGNGTLTWSLASGSLPANLSLNGAGTIAGTPTNAGNSNFAVRVTDSLSQTATKSLSIIVSAAPNPPVIITTLLPGGTVGVSYDQTLQATGGTGTLVWSRASGSLPANLSLNSNGRISGTPTNTGTSNFTVRVTDALSRSDTQPLSISITAALTITTNSLPNARVGRSYSTTLQRSGGVQPFNWSVSPALPPGLNLNSSTGVISGTPALAGLGSRSLTFTVRDSSTPTNQTANKTLTLTVNP
ncbi:hypothetical protein W02_07230 [Nitrospira sp. KM1]|nr:hypothetical protein W02_07230 [Nitrospira sp. KM1]